MKHGQRSQAKAKDVKKTSPKKGSASPARKESKGAGSKESKKAGSKESKGAGSKESSQRQSKGPVKASKSDGAKSSGQPAGRGAKATPAGSVGKKSDGEVSFTNPAVANAFKRALKKYPVALKRLSD